MKTEFKHALSERLRWRKNMKSWRSRNPSRDREIKKRYFERRRLRLLAAEETDESRRAALLKQLKKLGPYKKPGPKRRSK